MKITDIKIKDTWADRRYSLTAEQREEIRRLQEEGIGYYKLSKQYGVAYTTIKRIFMTEDELAKSRKISAESRMKTWYKNKDRSLELNKKNCLNYYRHRKALLEIANGNY